MIFTALAVGAKNQPYITRVWEYCPAPGQFINVAPAFAAGEDPAVLLDRVLELIGPKITPEHTETVLGNTYVVPADTVPITEELISLGAYGGYVVFSFDHPVVNVPDELDLQVAGNAFAGSCEPGIVMVSEDVNGNGVPDDPWYELAGSEYYKPTTAHDFVITYFKTPADHVATKQDRWIVDTTYIRWMCNDTNEPDGYIEKNSFHTQSYWPLWLDDETLIFRGTKLPNNVNNQGGSGDEALFYQDYYEWGYVDNRPDYLYNEPMTDSIATNCNLGFDLDWAVDEEGNPVKLNKVDFVKVYTAMNQKGGWIGETSTEVRGAIDLHPDAELIPEPEKTGDVNGDGMVNGSDVTALYEVILSGLKPEGNPDVSGDGNVNGSDVTVLYNILLQAE